MPEVIEKIGGDIDFVILDTMHVLPGEILDFLAILPYLKKNAVVVLHEVILNQRFNLRECHATTVLFSSVVADKFINYETDHVALMYTYQNIAAFQINEHTRENIENVFLTLMLRWKYYSYRNQIRAYYDIYKKNYSPELCKLFEQSLHMNYLSVKAENVIRDFQDGKIKI